MLIRRTEWFWLQLIMACLANAERQMQRRQSEVTDFHAKQYRLRNVTADTKINTLLLTLPQSDSPDVQYNVSSPDRFRVDDRGRVFTRVAGSDLLKDASSTSFAVNAFNTESSEMRVSKVLLLTGNQPPQFSDDSYEAYVYENAAQGSLVRAVVAQDPDTDPITYIIRKPGTRMDTSEYEMFTINKQTGVIRLVNRPFNFTQDEYSFTVVARDTHNQDATASVRVEVIDVNNNRPKFPDCDKYEPEVEENKDASTLVLTVKATDADKGANADLVYSLVTSPSSPDSLFKIDRETGVLTTAKSFNRDAPDHDKELRVIVKANDNGEPSLEGTCAFIVNVLDVNDNSPLFDKSDYLETIAKDTKPDTQVERVSATDDDVGDNGAITYSLRAVRPTDASDYFGIDKRTGVITLTRPLVEFAIDSEIRLEAVASDQGVPPRSSEAQVIITVKDSSTRPPSFIVKPDPVYTLDENYRDTETGIARLKAVSKLPGSPNVYYDVVSGSQEHTNKFRTFVVDEDGEGGAIVRYGGSRQLDYEQIKAYNITVEATTDQRTRAEVTFEIRLRDKNDEIPIFYGTDRAMVPENSPPGTFVEVATAVDGDSTSPNNQVSYSLDRKSPEYQLFSIESGTGRVSTRVRFDREDESRPSPFYTITVLAEDGSPSDIQKNGQPNQAKHRVTVEIGDENDNPPSFDPSGVYKASVIENSDIGSKVFDISAKDEDDDSKINYQITDGNFGAAFDIQPDTGVVTVKNQIDFEAIRKYVITVTASDGKYEDTHEVDVEVINQNDMPPVFDKQTYEQKLREGYLSSTPILKVRAVDPDPVGEPSIIYTLSGPGVYPDRPQDNVFSINPSGEVVVLKTLDRDEGTGGREVWELSVEAWDDGGDGIGSTVPFKLTLTDINDNAPYLIQSDASIPVIMENKSPDDIVISVEADDYDDHEKNGPPYTFRLDPSSSADIRNKFGVRTAGNGSRAEIRPLVKLDREQQKSYTVPVVISDNTLAEPATLTGTSLFTIIVGDENDNDMKPGSSVIDVFNFEGQMPETVVGRVYVEDPDDWDLPDKTFSWANGQTSGYFELDADTGDITIRYGTPNGSYPLKFQVYDKKFRSTVDADVTVTVRLLPRQAVLQSGSLRIGGLTAEQFVSPPGKKTPSMYQRMISELAAMLGTPPENVDLFGVQNNGAGGVDVRYAAHGSPYYRSEKMDGVVSQHKKQLEEVFKIEIQQVGIDDCIYETTCNSSCFSSLTIFEEKVYKVQTNMSTIIGVRTAMQYTCDACEEPPRPADCLNGGRPSTSSPPSCECPAGFDGPHCESLTIHFKGDGYAWLPHLTACNASHLSFDMTTSTDQGLVMYNGPMGEPTARVQDFFAVDVLKGRLRVFMNYGTGTAVASPQSVVDDGRRHHVDISWDTQHVTVRVDSCVGVAACQATAPAPAAADTQNAFLNVATPLQLGGTAVPISSVRDFMAWLEVPGSEGFFGCLENVTFLSTVYDLSDPAYGEEYSSYCDENIEPVPVIYATSSFLAVILCCLLFALILLVVGFVMRRRNRKKGYKAADTELRQTIVNFNEEGDHEQDNTKFDLSRLQLTDEQKKETGDGLQGAAAAPPPSTRDALNDKLPALDDKDGIGAQDDLRNYAYEGDGSSAGSLSSINSGTTDGDQNFDYLQELGPRFRRLADLYGDEADVSSSDGDDGPLLVPGSEPTESWC